MAQSQVSPACCMQIQTITFEHTPGYDWLCTCEVQDKWLEMQGAQVPLKQLLMHWWSVPHPRQMYFGQVLKLLAIDIWYMFQLLYFSTSLIQKSLPHPVLAKFLYCLKLPVHLVPHPALALPWQAPALHSPQGSLPWWWAHHPIPPPMAPTNDNLTAYMLWLSKLDSSLGFWIMSIVCKSLHGIGLAWDTDASLSLVRGHWIIIQAFSSLRPRNATTICFKTWIFSLLHAADWI